MRTPRVSPIGPGRVRAARRATRLVTAGAVALVLAGAPPVVRGWDGPVCEALADAAASDPLVSDDDDWCGPRRHLDVGYDGSTRTTGAGRRSLGREPLPNSAEERASLTEADARRALEAARVAMSAGAPLAARAHLRDVARWAPEIADRVALLDGEAALTAGLHEQACASFAEASRSPVPDIMARAEVGAVRCLLAARDRRGERALEGLLARYRALPQQTQLQLELAEARLAWGDRHGAVLLLVALDLEAPGSAQAARARTLLEDLRARGTTVPPLTDEQRVARAERLLRTGPMDAARVEVAALQANTALPATLAARVLRLASRIARAEGRFEEAAELAARADAEPADPARRGAKDDADPSRASTTDGVRAAGARQDATGGDKEIRERQETVIGVPSVADARWGLGERARREAREQLTALLRGRGVGRLPRARLVEAARLALRAGARPETEATLERLHAQGDLPPSLRLDLALAAVGLVDDELIAALLAPAVEDATVGVSARYHRARALERAGHAAEAAAEFERVRAADRSELRWYALWATLRLRALDALRGVDARQEALPLLASKAGPGSEATGEVVGAVRGLGVADTRGSAAEAGAAEAPGEPGSAPPPPPPTAADASDLGIDLARAIELLAPLARAHGDAFPWLRRALALARLGEADAASDELFMVWVANRQARGLPVPTAGLDVVYRGGAARRTTADRAIRRARAALPEAALATLADAAAALDDVGLAIRFGGRARAGRTPRPHAALVAEAAARHGLDPELLWAVMRVESVYDRRVVSYAGAMGLLQIMPRTGALIAHAIGRQDFVTADLLDPRTNIEFGAWYLASLLRRFDGRLPLAIAAYNGGPHNVRRWMAERPADMPLDAFLEHIPFAQTRRYVRRVLGHYAAYRADRGLDMVRLDVTLPSASVDWLAF